MIRRHSACNKSSRFFWAYRSARDCESYFGPFKTAPNFFNKKEQKDKTSIEDIHKTLQNIYGFKHINKFKDTNFKRLNHLISLLNYVILQRKSDTQ